MKEGTAEKYEGEAGTRRALRELGGGRESGEEKSIGGAAMAGLELVVANGRREAVDLGMGSRCLARMDSWRRWGQVVHCRASRCAERGDEVAISLLIWHVLIDGTTSVLNEGKLSLVG